MSLRTQPMQNLVEKIRSLPAERIAEVEDFVDFLKQRTQPSQPSQPSPQEPLDFPVISVGKWPEDLGLRREDMYDDDGR